MSISVELYEFKKKENSTAQPNRASASSFNCILKDECGIINPTIILDIGLSQSPSKYNYAFIPSFNRWYWIEEWTNIHPRWSANLKVDALASFKNDIGDTNLYVLRASNEYDGDIVDTLYPTKATTIRNKTVIDRTHSEYASLGDGGYICGIIMSDNLDNPPPIPDLSATYGSLTYVYITRNGLRKLSTALLDTSNYFDWGFTIDDATYQLQKCLVDPLQYIKSCMWVPYDLPMSILPHSLWLNGWEVKNIEYAELSNLIMINNDSITLNLPKHPNVNQRGTFLNIEPYSKIWLSCTPYGVIDLDTTLISNINQITVSEDLDLISGKGILTISSGESIIAKAQSQIGVNIQLSQIIKDDIGMITGALSNGASLATNLAMGNIGGAIASGLNGIGDAIASRKPIVSNIGGGGGFVDLEDEWSLNSEFFIPVDDDISSHGRPLCKIRKPKNLGGYMLIQDADVSINGTSQELSTIRNFLEGGFYYE